MKTRVNLTLEASVYAAAKAQIANLSELVNELLNNYLGAQEAKGEAEEMQAELEALLAKRNELAKAIASKSAQLVAVKEKERRAEKDNAERVNAVYDSIRANNPLDR